MAKQTGQSITSRNNPIVAVWGRHRIHHAYRLGWHDEMEINFIKEGAGCYFVEGKNISYGKNSVIVMQPREIHRLLSSPGSQVGKFCLMFDVKRMAWPKAVLKDVSSLRRHVSLTGGEAAIVEQIICKIIRESKDRKPGWEEINRTMLLELMFRIKRAEANVSEHVMHPVVRRALDYIEQHYAIPFNINDLASSMHVSDRHLFRLFERDVGLSIKHYVLQRRVLQAQRMIVANPAIKLEVVSEAVGFKQYSLFHRAFKKFTGLPPSAYGGI